MANRGVPLLAAGLVLSAGCSAMERERLEDERAMYQQQLDSYPGAARAVRTTAEADQLTQSARNAGRRVREIDARLADR